MADQFDLLPTACAKVFRISTLDGAGARAAARRIEPVDKPIEAIRESEIYRGLHSGNLANRESRWQREQRDAEDLKFSRPGN
jgi:hypothetical protein